MPPCPAPLASGGCWHLRCFSTGGVTVGLIICCFNYLFIFPPCYVALCASKACHRLGCESVSWCLEISFFLRLPSRDGAPSLPLLSLFFWLLYFSYPFLKTMICFSGCLMSSASIQKLFCGVCSTLKMFFWWICEGESGLPILFLRHIRTASKNFRLKYIWYTLLSFLKNYCSLKEYSLKWY